MWDGIIYPFPNFNRAIDLDTEFHPTRDNDLSTIRLMLNHVSKKRSLEITVNCFESVNNISWNNTHGIHMYQYKIISEIILLINVHIVPAIYLNATRGIITCSDGMCPLLYIIQNCQTTASHQGISATHTKPHSVFFVSNDKSASWLHNRVVGDIN